MAIAFDSSTIGGNNVTSYSHTCTGSDRILFVSVANRNFNTSSVTYNGVPLTLIGSQLNCQGHAGLQLWYLINPASGANNIVLNGGEFNSVAASYTGVAQTGAIDSTAQGSDADTSTTVSTTVVASNCWLVGAGWCFGTSPSTNKTLRGSGTFYYNNETAFLIDSNGPVGTGLQSAQFNGSNSVGTGGVLASFAPVPPVVAPTVTTQSATNIAQTTCTGNGNITATGGANCTRRGFCYKTGTSGDPTVSDSVAYDDGNFGTGAFTKSITGLTPNTSYRVRAYAVNSAGTSYGTTVDVKTLSAFIPRTMWF